MSRRLIELVVRARRLVPRAPEPASAEHPQARLTARRQAGRGELTQFSFRFALILDLACVGIGALGGAAIGRTSAPAATDESNADALSCQADSPLLPHVIR